MVDIKDQLGCRELNWFSPVWELLITAKCNISCVCNGFSERSTFNYTEKKKWIKEMQRWIRSPLSSPRRGLVYLWPLMMQKWNQVDLAVSSVTVRVCVRTYCVYNTPLPFRTVCHWLPQPFTKIPSAGFCIHVRDAWMQMLPCAHGRMQK